MNKIIVKIDFNGKEKTLETDMPINEEELYGFIHHQDFLWDIGNQICRLLKLPYPEL